MHTSADKAIHMHFGTLDIYPLHVDWRQLAHDLKAKNMSYQAQAAALGISWSTFENYLYHGSQPSFPVGNAFLVLHSKICGIEMTHTRVSVTQV